MKVLGLLAIIYCLSSCKEKSKQHILLSNLKTEYQLKHAKGFSITNFDTHKVLTVKKPWPNAKAKYTYALIKKEDTSKINLSINSFSAIIIYPIERIVVTSTTHIPALELLDEEESLVGFPGTEYISSTKTSQRISQGKIRDLGENEKMNTEVLLELKPDVVIGFGVEGVNKSVEIIKNAKIPVIYNGDWVEGSPLAKAEWLKLFGVLFNKEKQADSIFNKIEADYLNTMYLAQNIKHKPTVLCGAMHNSIWYLPSGNSPEAQLLQDANVNYLWQNTPGNGSLALSFETVFNKAKAAEFWLNPSYYSSRQQLKDDNLLYTNFESFKQQKIYSVSKTKGASGGVLYYELGITRPDLVLKDIIKICHPNLLNNYEPHFFKQLN